MPDAPMFAARAHVALRDIRLGAAVRNLTGQMVDGRQRRSADIEMTLTRGVHGPGELHVVVVDD